MEFSTSSWSQLFCRETFFHSKLELSFSSLFMDLNVLPGFSVHRWPATFTLHCSLERSPNGSPRSKTLEDHLVRSWLHYVRLAAPRMSLCEEALYKFAITNSLNLTSRLSIRALFNLPSLLQHLAQNQKPNSALQTLLCLTIPRTPSSMISTVTPCCCFLEESGLAPIPTKQYLYHNLGDLIWWSAGIKLLTLMPLFSVTPRNFGDLHNLHYYGAIYGIYIRCFSWCCIL